MIEQEFATPGEALVHFGIKGMHWGQRKEQAVATTTVYAQRGAVQTKSLLKSGRPYGSAAIQAAGAVYLHRRGYSVPAYALGASAALSADRAYKRQQVQ